MTLSKVKYLDKYIQHKKGGERNLCAHRFGIYQGWQRRSERWLSTFPALAEQMVLLSGFRGAGPQKGHRRREAEGRAGLTRTDEDTGAGRPGCMVHTNNFSFDKQNGEVLKRVKIRGSNIYHAIK